MSNEHIIDTEDQSFTDWLASQAPEDRKRYEAHPAAALWKIKRDIVTKLKMLAQCESAVLEADSDARVILSVGNARINREQMGQLRDAVISQLGEAMAARVLIVAMDAKVVCEPGAEPEHQC